MEKISELALICSEAARFRVLPLWAWTLASVELSDGIDQYWGTALELSRKLALAKAESEAIERSVYYTWERTMISPFTGEKSIVPPSSCGFAAHPNSQESRLRAFFEWRERAALLLVSQGRFQLHEVSPPNLGILFQPALRKIQCGLKVLASTSPPYVSFAYGNLNGKGVIFGSSCYLDQSSAIKAATVECIRKLAFCDQWRAAVNHSSELSTAAKYWLAPVGLKTVEAFCQIASKAPSGEDALPGTPNSLYSQNVFVRGRTVSFYLDPEFELPKIAECQVPIL